MKKLTPKQERFCLEMIKPKATQYKAYTVAFNAKKMKRATIDNEAYKLMQIPEIAARLNELMTPVVEKVRVTKAEWLEKMQAFFHADVRKMYDEFGNPIEVPKLGDNEALMIEGFEFCEDYTKVKKSDGSTDAVPTGYTKKYKLTSKLKAMLEFGKVMGWYDDPADRDKGPTRIFIRTWVNREERHVHIHTPNNTGIPDSGVSDGAGDRAAARGTAVAAGASGRGGTNGPPEGAGREGGRAGHRDVHEHDATEALRCAGNEPKPRRVSRRVVRRNLLSNVRKPDDL